MGAPPVQRPLLPLPGAYMLGLCLALPAPLPPDLIACILARILGHAGEKVGKDINGDIPSSPTNPWVLSFATPPVKEKSMDGHRFFLASDAALQPIEVLVKGKNTAGSDVSLLRMESNPVSLAILRGFLRVTGGVLYPGLDAIHGEEKEEIPVTRALLPPRQSCLFSPWRKKQARCHEQNILAAIPALTVHDLDAALAVFHHTSSTAFWALHANLLQTGLGKSLDGVPPSSLRKVRL